MPTATDAEIARLVDELDRGRQAWIGGALETAATDHMVQDDAMTIFGPFGGEAAVVGPMQAKIAALFHGGTGRCELVKAMADGDLLVLVMIERNDVTFGGHATPQPWVLRTTQVFRRDGARWRRLHRHADPLITRRSLDETLALLAPPAAQ
jgi:hypothetical protein